MITLWKKESSSDSIATIADGVSLSETEATILIHLAGRLSLNELRHKGLSDEDAFIVMNWSSCI